MVEKLPADDQWTGAELQPCGQHAFVQDHAKDPSRLGSLASAFRHWLKVADLTLSQCPDWDFADLSGAARFKEILTMKAVLLISKRGERLQAVWSAFGERFLVLLP